MLLLPIAVYSQNYEAGESIFKANCVSCHKMDAKVIGPPLANVVEAQGAEWTKKWIYNNEELRASGDAHALAIYEEYNKQVMPAYSFLTDQELDNLVGYLENWQTKQEEVVEVKQSVSGEVKENANKVERKLSSAGKVIIAAFVLAASLIAITFGVLLSAFKTMVQVNQELQRKKD